MPRLDRERSSCASGLRGSAGKSCTSLWEESRSDDRTLFLIFISSLGMTGCFVCDDARRTTARTFISGNTARSDLP